MDWQALGLSLRLSCLTSLLLLSLGLPVAYWLTFSKFKFKFILEAFVSLPLVLPPTVLGFYILVAIGPHSPVGRLYEDWTGNRLPFSFEGVLLGSVLYSLPFAVQPFQDAFAAIDSKLIEASWVLGGSKLRTFVHVMIPLSLSGIMTGMLLTFAHTLGEFGIVLMIGGNIPGSTRTISIALFDEVQAMDYIAAGRTSLFLLVLSFSILIFIRWLRRTKKAFPTLLP